MDSAPTSASEFDRAAGAISPKVSSAVPPQTSIKNASPSALQLQDIRRFLVDSADEGMSAIDADGLISFVNPALCRMTGWSEEELLGQPHNVVVGQFSTSSDPAAPAAPLSLADRSRRGVWRGEDALLLRKEGGSFPAAYTCSPIFRDNQLSATVIVFQDISESRRAEQWERDRSIIFSAILSNQALHATLRMLAAAFVARYPGKSIVVLLRKEQELCVEAEAGWPEGTLQTESVSSDFCELLTAGVSLCLATSLVSATAEDWGVVAVFDRNGGTLDDAMRGTIQRVCDLACVAFAHQQMCEEIAHHSEADHLRTSPAQVFLEKCLRPAMETARLRKKIIAVGSMDLDRLQQINGSLGHEYGAALIKAVGDRLDQCLRDVDIPFRYGGGAFLFAICDLNQASQAEEICQRLLRKLREPFLVKGHLLATTASIGISLYPHHGLTADLLLRHADIALQAVKRADRGGALIYSAALGQQSQRAAEMPEALLHAIRNRQFHVAYQPIYNMKKQIAGFEALLRWKHPEWGFISPLEFIPIAERTGLIVPIGDWVVHEVCRQAMAWGADSLPGIKFFANVSGVQLERSDFASKIANTLRRSGLPPDRLELEITESWVISDLKGAARKLVSLRDLGIGIAIDDFGTGHSTFTYLQELPLDTIKIDRSFTNRLDGTDGRPSTVRAITMMAQRLGLKIVAEGVETSEQATELADIGCDLMQGFLLSRPLGPEDASALLQEQLARDHSSLIDAQLSESRP